MHYSKNLNKLLKPRKKYTIKVLDLFAGCGGLSLGFEAAGFETIGLEMNAEAAKSYNKNLNGSCETIKLSVDYNFPKADIVIGGPPCQPFSVVGKQKGVSDSRNGFPIFVEAVRQINPKIFILENVMGLAYSNRDYLNILIEQFKTLGYIVECSIVNAENYGVPQKRQRLIVVGHKSKFSFPIPSLKKISVLDAIGDLIYSVAEDSKFLTPSMDNYIAKYEKASACTTPRDLHLSKPSRTLTCKNLAGATGDMIRILLEDGRRRRLSVKEAARLQSFPDWFSFEGSEASKFKQIGNSVPPLLAYSIAKEVYITFIKKCKSQSCITKINLENNRILSDKIVLTKAI